jgi:DNA invertase Pin-like site-specific DNA recombinase
MKENKVAIVYCRADSLLEEGRTSLIEDSSRCIRKALDDGYKKCECILDVRSGIVKKRFINRELKSLRKLVRSQKVDVLYVTSLCSLSKDTKAVGQLLDYFKRYQVRVVICDSV